VFCEPNISLRKIIHLKEEKQEIIEMFGVHFEKTFNIPPLAARIIGTLIIEGCKSGLTFDELVNKIQASKSSVSTNLNLLQKMGKVNYFTKVGDRKKYFKAAPLSQRLNEYLALVNNEKILIDRVIDYRKKTITCSQEEVNLQNHYAYKEHMIKAEQLLIHTINQFKEIETQNQSDK
jgi:DNA-binding transcriptional regulator GbsR (MarR family)